MPLVRACTMRRQPTAIAASQSGSPRSYRYETAEGRNALAMTLA